MCWSGEASLALASIGFATTAYSCARKDPMPLWGTLAYFSLMEALQAYTYFVIDDCSSPANHVATYLGYLHICFQPFFANWLFMHFIPNQIRERIQFYVYTLCGISSIFMLVQIYPFDWAGSCTIGKVLCSQQLCSVSGDWHIAWEVPYNSIGSITSGIPVLDAGFFTYSLTVFLMPFLYGSWRINLYHIIFGPLLARLLTDNPNEFPAVWCLLSIAFLLIVVKTPLRNLLHVKSWPGWRPEALITTRFVTFRPKRPSSSKP